MSEGTPRPRRMLNPWVYIALPLIALATDLAFFPLLESRVAAPPLSVESLVLHGRQAVGRIRLHEIKATLDTLDAPAFAADVRDGPSAIIVPCFLMTDSRGEKDVEIGQLGRYVQGRLTAISPNDSAQFSAILNPDRMEKGMVSDLPLYVAAAKRSAFPFDHIFLVTLAPSSQRGTADESVFGAAVPRVLRLAEAAHLKTLVVPAVGYNYANKNSISFRSIYRPLFNGLPSGGPPDRLVLDLYREWPTFSVEQAVAAIDEEMNDYLLDNPITRLHRQDFRLLLLLSAVCLFASGRYVVLTAKRTAVIVTAYFGLCLGTGGLLDLIAAGWSGAGRTGAQVLLFGALACLFPIIIRWKVDQLFPPERAG